MKPTKDRLMLERCLDSLRDCITESDWKLVGKDLRNRLETYLKETDPDAPLFPYGY